MELGATKELDTVGENAFACADSLQRIEPFRSTGSQSLLYCSHQAKKRSVKSSFPLRQS